MKRLSLVKNTMHPIYRPITTDSRPGPAPPDAALSLNIMSFNIRRGTAKDGRNHWIFRRNLVHEILDRYRPDVLGLQEAMDFQITALHRMLPGYEMVGTGNLGGSKGMHTAIFFNAARFSLSDEGTLWLSDTPDIPGSKGWGNVLPRTCTWVRLVEKDSRQAFYFYNTHLDHISLRSRKKSVVFLTQHIHARSFPGPFCPDGRFQCQGKKCAHPISQRQSLSENEGKRMGIKPDPFARHLSAATSRPSKRGDLPRVPQICFPVPV